MKELYRIARISKQAVWKSAEREEYTLKVKAKVVSLIDQIRRENKRMGCRTAYYAVKKKNDPFVGRDLFEQIGFANGLRLKRKRNKIKTTWGQRIEVFPDLISGLTINNINMVFQSDIFYLEVERLNYYGIGIEDVYSRKLLALHISQSLSANENLKAVKKALAMRKGHQLEGCIFHSDRGCQYISTAHKMLLRSYKMKLSMGKLPQQNAYAERINGTLKNDYFYERHLTSENVQRHARRIMYLYNNIRPHTELKMMTPVEFESYVNTLGEKDRPKHLIHKWE